MSFWALIVFFAVSSVAQQNLLSTIDATAPNILDGFHVPITRLPINPRLRLGQTTGNIPVASARQFAYSIQLTFGSQTFSLCLDTGSSDLWVVSTNCMDQDCQAVPQYNPGLVSQLTSDPFNLNYLMGYAEGSIAFSDVQIGSFLIESQAFALVDKTAQLDLASTGTSGIVGLSFPATAAISPTVGATFLANLMSEFEEDSRFIAFHLSRDDSGSTNDPNASFTVGTLDPAFVPDPTALARSAVIRTGSGYDYWKLGMFGMTVNGVPFQISSSRIPGQAAPVAVLDSGTTLLLGPTADVAALYALFGSAVQFSGGTYMVRCTYAAVLSIVLGDTPVEYPIHPSDIAWAESKSDGWCTGGIQPNDGVSDGDWLLGDVFLRNVYVVQYSSESPAIGLLSVTDPAAALSQFRSDRGADVGGDPSMATAVADANSWDATTGFVKRWEQHTDGLSAYVLGLIAGGIGFVVGSIGVLGWRLCRGV